MDLKNIDKLHEKAGKALVPYLEKLLPFYANDLVSVFVYGSATGPDFDPRSSDINLGIVLKDNSIERLKPSSKILARGLLRRISIPLFLTLPYIERSRDTFPVEFLNMRDTSTLLYGQDILSALKVGDDDLRRECEHQIKGKLITIRQAYFEMSPSAKRLEALVRMSLRSLVPVFRACLKIKCGSAPLSRAEVLRNLEVEFGVNMKDASPRPADKFIADFLGELEKLSEEIDRI